MKFIFTKAFLVLGMLFFHGSSIEAQVSLNSEIWQKSTNFNLRSVISSEVRIKASNAAYYELDYQNVYEQLLIGSEEVMLEIPIRENEFKTFYVKANATMHSGLAEKFPTIRSFNIVSEQSKSIWGKMDVSPNGLHAAIFEPGEPTLFIDPVFNENTRTYIVYKKNEFITDKSASCELSGETIRDSSGSGSRGSDYNDCELSNYELAVATTGEYTNFHGGTVEDALAAVVTTVNRVNMVFERDFAVTMTLIENNDEIIFTDPNSDPYSNGSAGAMISQNQNTINSIIGSANYDVGHLFGTSGSGLAAYASTCISSQKARGITGIGSPIGDPFDIDYVAHEIGHQFAGSHSFNNSCSGNRNNSTAVEPGSGSTIMAYGGICTPNVQNGSDDYFHGVNMEEMGQRVGNNQCQTRTPLVNFAPVIEDLPVSIAIPASTPFILTAQASDEDGDILTYCWEQMDNNISNQPPEADSFNGPNFRSLSPTISPTRYFPALPNTTSTTWEVLPNTSRDMDFRVTVRDNAEGGGCTQYDDITVEVYDDAGPFVVEVPSDAGIVWESFTEETVFWDVANTDDAPISAATVDIYLSTNGGNSYPILLADDVPNSGAYTLEVPSFSTAVARIMVMNSEGTFFDISNNNFTITGGVQEGIVLLTDDSGFVCEGDDTSFDILAQAAFGFSEPISLSIVEGPAGLGLNIENTILTPGQSTILNVTNTGSAPVGTSIIVLQGESGEFSTQLEVALNINELNPVPVDLIEPANAATGIGAVATFNWSESESPVITYDLELSLDEDFNDLFGVFNNIQDNSFEVQGLPLESELYWRVRKDNGCGSSISGTNFFSTGSCLLNSAQDLPITIGAIAGTIESNLEVFQVGTIERVRVSNLKGLHGRVSDLTARLISPQGTEVVLFAETCDSDDDFDLSFEDGANETIDCPPTTGLFYAPAESLSVFNGEEASGTWVLRIEDSLNGGGGVFEGWQLELCYEGSILSTTSTDLEAINVFPNPTNDLVQISIGTSNPYDFIQVMDSRGRLILEKVLTDKDSFVSFSMAQHETGVYIISFIGNGVGQSIKLIKTQ